MTGFRLRQWVRKILDKRITQRRVPHPFRRSILRVEILEDRITPSAVSWTGAGDGTSWFDSRNWSNDAVPGLQDDVTINSAFANINLPSSVSVQSLTLVNGTLTDNGGLTVGSLNVSGGSLAGSGNATVNGSFNWTAGTLSGTGDTVLNGASSIDLANSFFSPLERQVDNYGTATVADGTSITFENNPIWNNEASATLVLPGSASLSNFFSNGSQLNNAGVVEKTGPAGTSTIAIVFNNTGSVEVEAGTLSLTGGGTSGATFTVDAGAVLTGGVFNPYTFQNAAVTGDGTVQLPTFVTLNVTGPSSVQNLTLSGGTLTADAALNVQNLTLNGGTLSDNGGLTVGDLTLSGGTLNATGGLTVTNLNMSGGTLNDNDGLTVTNLNMSGGALNDNDGLTATDLNMSGGSLAGSGNATVNGSFNWTAGTLSGTGDTVLNGTSSIDLANSFFSPLERQVDNYGTATVADGTSITFENNPIWNNEAGATLVLPGSASLSNFFSNGSQLNNAGAVEKTGPAGTSTIAIAFNNSGSVDVQAGTFSLTGGGTGGSTFTIEAGAVLNPGSSSTPYTFQNATVTGDGTVQLPTFFALNVTGASSIQNLNVSGGTLTAGAALNVQNLNVSSGAITDNGGLTVGNLTVSGGTLTDNSGLTVTALILKGGNLTENNGLTVGNLAVSGGTLTANGSLTVPDLTLSGGTLTGSGDVTVNNTFNWTAGTLSGTGDTVLNGASSIDLANSFFSPLERQVDNYGTATVANGTSITFENNPIWNNEAGATLVLPGSASLSNFFSNGSQLNNAGVVEKTGPAGTSTIAIVFNNTGSVEVEAGTLSLTGGGTSGATFTVDAGAVLTGGVFNPYTFQNAAVTGDGTVQLPTFVTLNVTGPSSVQNLTLSGGTLTADAALNVQNLTVSGGTLSDNGGLTVGDLTLSGGTLNATGGLTVTNLNMSGGTLNDNGGLTATDLDMSGGTLNDNGGLTVGSLNVSGGALAGSGNATVNDTFNWTGGTLSGTGDTVLNGTSSIDLANSFFTPLERQVDNYGTATVANGTSITFENNAVWNNEAGATLVLPGSVTLGNFFSNGSQLNNAGLILAEAPAGTSSIAVQVNNTGTIEVDTGTLSLAGLTNLSGTTLTGGTYIVAGVLKVPNADIQTNAATIVLNGPSAEIFNSSSSAQNNALSSLASNAAGGNITLEGGSSLATLGDLSNAGNVAINAGSLFTAGGNYTQTAGATVVDGTLTANNTVTINGGSLSGGGTINANVTNAGQVTPGDAPAVLTVQGNYTQTAAGALNIEIDGPDVGTGGGGGYSQLAVSGSATLAGTLNVTDPNGYEPNVGDLFHILTFASHTGDFDTYNLPDLGNGLQLQPQLGNSGLDLATFADTKTTLTASTANNTSVYGQDVTFTATVTPDGTGTPGGTVQFLVNGVNAGNPVTLSGGTATFDPGTLNVGTYQVSATYNGGGFFLGSTSSPLTYVVTQAGTVTTGAAPSTTNYGQAVTLTATVTANAPSTATPTGSVDFFDTTTQTDLGSAVLSGGTAALTTTAPLPPGTQTITLTYTDPQGNFVGSSSTVTLTVLPSIYVLDPSASGALSLVGNAHLSSSGLVQVDSTSAAAVQANGNDDTNSPVIDVVGGVSVTGNTTFSSTPVTGAAPVSDPLSGLAVPTGLAFQGSVSLTGDSSLTINPGVYTQIAVSGNAHLVLNPGIYVIAGGGFVVSGSASVTGTGVLLYNAGSDYLTPGGDNFGGISISGNANVDLTAATTGAYAGIAIFQARDNTQDISLGGQAVLNVHNGVVYAPSAALTISGNAEFYNGSLVADLLSLSGATDVSADLS